MDSTVKKYIRKEVQVFEVMEYNGNVSDCKRFIEDSRTNHDHWPQHGCSEYRVESGHLKFPTNDGGYRTVKPGDYLIKRQDGVWPYDRDMFNAKYQQVST